ncbi:MAG: 4-(cytidine 5'-diphospho)-2-C-methyl-D-erythritol kinase [Candidatus Omnitrophica bacterium]|nr:4-(cytidine 5'-diphospho)-2-C-methyl-D-erythritol kinase [Candidatus Omnitrophota bacterium]
MKSIVLHSPAKLNLFLKIINKRPDNYHNIETVFERISLFDEIAFREINEDKIRIICNHRDVPTGPKNLIYKAVTLIRRDFCISQGVEVTVKKQIPVAAGLAGGSSNAATTLLGINKLWKLGLSREELVKYAKVLGSDVAFFLHDTSWALGTERGDKITPLKIKSKLSHILVVPRIKVYSKDIYGAINLGLTKRSHNATILIQYLKHSCGQDIDKYIRNDLEQTIIGLNPALQGLKQRLKLLGIKGVMISGSGPAVFGITDNERHAESIKDRLDKVYSQVFVVKTS